MAAPTWFTDAKRVLALAAPFLLVAAASNQERSPPIEADASSSCELQVFLHSRQHRYLQAVAAARRWLGTVYVDPAELRVRGIKGKKKLVELMDAYYRLWRIAGEADRPALFFRFEEIVAITYEDRYHDMSTLGERWFKQDATSYLRAAVLMDRLGLRTERYRQEIFKIQDRLNAHMHRRGPYQRRVFHWYYQYLGLKEPFPLGDALEDGVIAKRLDPQLMKNDDVYALTHEIFGPYEYGDRLDADPFDASEKGYLGYALDVLAARYMTKNDPDLLAEVISSMRMVRLVDLPTYTPGLAYLLDHQNVDGSWGDYERYRKRYGEYIKQGFILHTTTVVLDALTLAFHEPWNRDLGPICAEP